jgi:hypothetical protein
MLRYQDVDPWASSSGSEGLVRRKADALFGLLGRVLGGIVEGAIPRGPWAWFASRVVPPAVGLLGFYTGYRSFTTDRCAFGLTLLAWVLAALSTVILAYTDRKWLTRIFMTAAGVTLVAGLIVDFPAALMGVLWPALVIIGVGLSVGLPWLGRFLRRVGQED